MSSTWTPRIVDIGALDGRSRGLLLDVAAARAAPLRTHPHCVRILCALARPADDGTCAEHERAPIDAVGDEVIASMGGKFEARFVARLIESGVVTWFFYAPDRVLAQDPLEMIDDVRAYTLRSKIAFDPGWRTYQRELSPVPYPLQARENREIVDVLLAAGDRLGAPRLIEHWAYFASEDKARCAAQELAGRGFEASIEPDEDRGTGLRLRRCDAVDQRKMDLVCAEILDIVLAHQGTYDGWESPVVD